MSVIRNPPAFNDGDDYEAWKNDVEMWSDVTDIAKEKQAVVVHLSLSGKARKASSELKSADLKSVGGMKKLMEKLDRVFLQDPNWKCFNAYLAFENLRRNPNAPFDDYLSEFDSMYYKLKECGVNLPDAVIACRLLKSCNLNDVYFQLALSTTREMTFEAMRATLKKLFSDSGNSKSGASISVSNRDDEVATVQVKSEPMETLYGAPGGRGARGRGRGRGRPGRPYGGDNWSSARRDYNRCYNYNEEGAGRVIVHENIVKEAPVKVVTTKKGTMVMNHLRLH